MKNCIEIDIKEIVDQAVQKLKVHTPVAYTEFYIDPYKQKVVLVVEFAKIDSSNIS